MDQRKTNGNHFDSAELPMDRFIRCDPRDFSAHCKGGFQTGHGFKQGDGRKILAELRSKHSRYAMEDFPTFIAITAPTDNAKVFGYFIVRYDHCVNEANGIGAVKITLTANGVQIREVNHGPDNFMPSFGNRFILDSTKFDKKVLILQVFMRCSDNSIYESNQVKVIIDND